MRRCAGGPGPDQGRLGAGERWVPVTDAARPHSPHRSASLCLRREASFHSPGSSRSRSAARASSRPYISPKGNPASPAVCAWAASSRSATRATTLSW